MNRSEKTKFLSYRKLGSTTVAVFENPFPFNRGESGKTEDTFVLEKSNCASRLENLKRDGCPHDQTALALEKWSE